MFDYSHASGKQREGKRDKLERGLQRIDTFVEADDCKAGNNKTMEKNNSIRQTNSTYEIYPIEEKEEEEDFQPYLSKMKAKHASYSEGRYAARLRTESLNSRDSSFIARSSLHRSTRKRTSIPIVSLITAMVSIPQFPPLHKNTRQAKLNSRKRQSFQIEKEANLHLQKMFGSKNERVSRIQQPKVKILNVGKMASSSIFLRKSRVRQDSGFESNSLHIHSLKKLLPIVRKKSNLHNPRVNQTCKKTQTASI